MTTPPPDTKVQSETLKEVADDLPYRIVEEMGLGLAFRSCTCGQLPCARLRPIRDALEAVRRNERERAAKLCDKEAAEWVETARNYSALDPMRNSCLSRAEMAEELAKAIREGR